MTPRRAMARAAALLLLASLALAEHQDRDSSRADLVPEAVETRISRVLLYSTGARVTRTGKIGPDKFGKDFGVREFRFAGLPPVLDPDSIQAVFPGHPEIEISDVVFSIDAETRYRQDRVDEIAKERNANASARQDLDDEKAILVRERQLVHGVALPDPIPPSPEKGPEPLPPIPVGTWKAFAEFATGVIEKDTARIREIEKSLEAIAERDRVLEEELKALTVDRLPATGVVRLRANGPSAVGGLGAGGAGKGYDVEISYQVGGCAWFPAYEFQMGPKEAVLVEQALVAQNTGEDWTGADLNLSTALPERIARVLVPKVFRIGEKRNMGAIEPLAFGLQGPKEEKIARAADIPPPPVVTREAGELPPLPPVLAYEGSGSGVGGVDLAAALAGGDGYESRTGGGRRNLVAVGGGSAASESSVERSPRWSARHQSADGSFRSLELGGTEDRTELDTALILLGWLGAGYTDEQGRYADNIRRALQYLASRSDGSGSIGSDLLTQAVSTLALAEAHGMTNRYAEPAQKAVQALSNRILRDPLLPIALSDASAFPSGAQNVAWMTMALKSAKLAGLEVPQEAFDRLLELVESVESAPPNPRSLAATALARTHLGESLDSPRLAAAAAALLKTGVVLPDPQHVYLATLFLFQRGGEDWDSWNRSVKDGIISCQVRDNSDSDGSWDPAGLADEGASRAYVTGLFMMCLEVYYRYLPVYGGGKGGAEAGKAPASLASRLSRPFGPAWRHPARSARGRDFRIRAIAPVAIPSDGKYRPVPLDRHALPAEYIWRAQPLASKQVFRGAMLRNPRMDRPLLSGEARVLDGARFLGTTLLPTIPPGVPFVLPLGPDDRILAARQVEQVERKGGLVEIGVSLQVKNASPEIPEARVFLYDRVPVSWDDDVRVRDVQVSKPGRILDKDTGGCVWEFKVLPGRMAAAGLRYSVQHGSKVRVEAIQGAPGLFDVEEEGDD